MSLQKKNIANNLFVTHCSNGTDSCWLMGKSLILLSYVTINSKTTEETVNEMAGG